MTGGRQGGEPKEEDKEDSVAATQELGGEDDPSPAIAPTQRVEAPKFAFPLLLANVLSPSKKKKRDPRRDTKGEKRRQKATPQK